MTEIADLEGDRGSLFGPSSGARSCCFRFRRPKNGEDHSRRPRPVICRCSLSARGKRADANEHPGRHGRKPGSSYDDGEAKRSRQLRSSGTGPIANSTNTPRTQIALAAADERNLKLILEMDRIDDGTLRMADHHRVIKGSSPIKSDFGQPGAGVDFLVFSFAVTPSCQKETLARGKAVEVWRQ